MGTAEQAAITCNSCGKKYAWKAELRGKTVRCKCGQMILIPAPAAEEDLYDLAPEPKAPAQAPAVGLAAAKLHEDPQEILKRLGRVPGRISKVHEEATKEARHEEEALLRGSPLRDILAPVVLIALGMVLSYVDVMGQPEGKAPTTALAATPVVALRLALSVGLMLAGVFMATSAADVCLVGSFQKSILKLIGVAVGPAALYGICTHAFGEQAGPAVGAFASLAAYWVLFFFLMRCDAKDSSILVLITWILVAAANYVAYKAEGAARGSWI